MAIHKLEKHTDYDAISRSTVNLITDSNALALWVYLITKPETWIPREKNIREHFCWGHDKYRNAMTFLKELGLADWDVRRSDNGRITGKTLHIYPETNARSSQQQAEQTASLPDDIENKDILDNKYILDNKDKNSPPYSDILNLFHEKFPTLQTVRKLTAERKKHINARWKDDLETIDDWVRYFDHMKTSDWVMGRIPGFDGKPFKATFDFFLKEKTVIQAQEGKYHVRKQEPRRPEHRIRERETREPVQRWWLQDPVSGTH